MRQLKIATQITNRDSQAVEKYLQEISKIQMVTPEEESMLAQKIRMGDQAALEKLVQSNLRFVVSVAKQYQHQGLSLSDLINEGNLGLIKAAQRFDETKGFKFISYAVWWIRQSILQSLAEQGRLVRLPQNKIGTFNKANKALMAFEQENEREPSLEELAMILDMPEQDINSIFSGSTRHTSLDAPLHDTEDVAMGDLLEGGDETDEEVMRNSLKEEISRVLKSLSNREAEILIAYFGLGGEDAPTIEQVGEKYELTKERVRQIKERAIKRLQKTRFSSALKGYLGQ
ncbi:MAG: RNA polymerase sigma factor RpoD/SigA [Chitinophagia bacterium]|nr:RNA polymerase sigma factor RpoD/SigA [Chitinophagia bacterium]